MKKKLISWCIFFSVISIWTTSKSCPTCLGRSKINTKEFFAKEFYKIEKEHDETHKNSNKVGENIQTTEKNIIHQNQTEQVNAKEQS